MGQPVRAIHTDQKKGATLMKQQSLEQLLLPLSSAPYSDQYRYILGLISENRVSPVKSSAKNGKKPALHTRYWIIEEQPDYSEALREIRYGLFPPVSPDYYLSHPEEYLADRDDVLALNTFLRDHADRLQVSVSLHERSFEIWGREKYLTDSCGPRILKRCRIPLDFLNCYPTAEPFSYFAHSRQTPQNLLILENKDPFFSMRKHLLSGHSSVFSEEIGTLIYGAGKRVLSSFSAFDISAEPYMSFPGNRFLYFGDLDYEGIGIYERLAAGFSFTHSAAAPYASPVSSDLSFSDDSFTPPVPSLSSALRVIPWRAGYLKMLEKGEARDFLPETREKQNRNLSGAFFSFFSVEEKSRMLAILESDRYIPQEILNLSDFGSDG